MSPAMEIEYKLETMVLDITPDKELHAVNSADGYLRIQAGAIILAMGCRERTRGALSIPGTRPSGVFTAGTAQRYINMEGYMVGKRVVILGSGDIGLIMARRLTLEGARVLAVAELLPFPGGLTRNIVQCLDDFNIPLYLSHTVIQVKGKKRVTGVTIARVGPDRRPIAGTEIDYDCDTLLLSVGLIPENELSQTAGIELDPVTGGPVVNEIMETTVAGIFACGNVAHVHDLVDFVTEESRRAGKNAARYVRGLVKRGGPQFVTKAGKGVGYLVPQKARIANLDGKLELFLRVRDVSKNAKLVVQIDGEVWKEFFKSHLAPGEMEHLSISAAELPRHDFTCLTVAVKAETECQSSII